jgi:DNA-binding SARP family transcriptional activator
VYAGRGPREPEPAGPGVEIQVLGTPVVYAAGPVPAGQRDLLTELVVCLALHPEGFRPGALARALWPEGASDDTVSDAVHLARAWLGADSAGRPRIATDPDGRLVLGGDVGCDWWRLADAAAAARGGRPVPAGGLSEALRLVTGPPLADLPAGRYGWLRATGLDTSIRATVVDVAHRLAADSLATGDTATAMAACRTGLRAVPAAEDLWRDLLRTVAARGDRAVLTAVVGEMYRALGPADGRGRGPRGEPETTALVRELLPGYRPPR